MAHVTGKDRQMCVTAYEFERSRDGDFDGGNWTAGYERLYGEAVQRLQQLGGVPVPVDFEPFATTAELLYTSAFLAERYSGVRSFLEAGQVRFPPSSGPIVTIHTTYSYAKLQS